MNVGKLYTIRLVEDPNMGIDPHMIMDPLPLDLNSPCMKNKCMKIKKHLKPQHDIDHDYMVDILNKLDGSMSMPNVKIMSNMFEPKLFKGSKRSSKKKKGKKTKKIKIKSILDLLPDEILSDPSFKFIHKKSKSKKKKSKRKSKRSSKKKDKKNKSKRKSKKKSKKNKSFIF